MSRKMTRTNIFWMMLALGFLTILQMRTLGSGVRYIPLQQIQQAQLTLNKENAELQQLREKVQELSSRADKLDKGTDVQQEVARQMQDEIRNIRVSTGLEDVEGSGVVILISDSTRSLFEQENPNDLLVHDFNIRTIVNDLRFAGAEAVSVNGNRIVDYTSPIYCNGPTIKVNDQMCSPPFIIKAIGNPQFLEAAINAPDKYGDTLRQWGLFIEVDTSVNVKIPAYKGDIQYKYMVPVKEGV